ncbi:MAG: FAD-dependent oxidoreductase [Deltaproteobacteria bacterium]|nr:FAD-dependent oxidoreductase [Deltaproteobacteria bacterium]
MKQLLVLGAGSGGTMVANRMRRRLGADWMITVVDPAALHLYQPGLLFLPFGANDEAAMLRPRRRTLSSGVAWIEGGVTAVDPLHRSVKLHDGQNLTYDFLVVASGARLRFDMTPGLDDGRARGDVHDFYSLEGAQALRTALAGFGGGRLVVNVVEMPIKCPVAPLEFLFLADAFFTRRGMRDKVELVYATPLDSAFTRPLCAKHMQHLLAQKGIALEREFAAGEVDAEHKLLRSYDQRELAYDLLVSIPTHSGAAFVEDSGLGNELAFLPTHKQTLQVEGQERLFALGDATALPSSKAGSVAHFQAEVLETNLLEAIAGRAPKPEFDGHANCFVETGHGKAMLIDFNYDVDPLPGRYPIAGLGPFSLLSESRMNHLGKLAFRWLYWNGLLPGRPIPVSARLSMSGKRLEFASPSASQTQGS